MSETKQNHFTLQGCYAYQQAVKELYALPDSFVTSQHLTFAVARRLFGTVLGPDHGLTEELFQ
jgi:hypothetical protein